MTLAHANRWLAPSRAWTRDEYLERTALIEPPRPPTRGTPVDALLAAIGESAPWQNDALCREYPAVDFMPGRGGDVATPKAICSRCLVRDECGQYANAARWSGLVMSGIWGGISERERKKLRAATLNEQTAA